MISKNNAAVDPFIRRHKYMRMYLFYFRQFIYKNFKIAELFCKEEEAEK